MLNKKICRGRNSQLVVSCQVVTTPCCGLTVICCGVISHLIGRETINIPEIFSGVHGFTGKTVSLLKSEAVFRHTINLDPKTRRGEIKHSAHEMKK